MSESSEPAGLKGISGRRAVFDVLGTARRVAPGALLTSLAEPLGAFGSACLPVLVTWLVNAIVARQQTSTWVLSVVLALVCSFAIWTTVVGTNARVTLRNRVGFAYDAQVLADVNAVTYLDDVSNPEFRNHTQLVTERSMMLGNTTNQWILALRNATQFVVLIVAGLLISPWLLLIPVASVPSLLMEGRLAGLDEKAEDASAPASRGKDALLTGFVRPETQDEVQLWGAAAFLRGRVEQRLAAWRAPYNTMAGRRLGLAIGPALLTQVVAMGVMAWLVWQALDGTGSIGIVAGALLLVDQLQSMAAAVPAMMQWLNGSTRAAKRVLWLRDYAARKAPDVTPERGGRAARFVAEHLTYRYPGAEADALTDISVELPVGGAVALVGANGSGKTTFLDLLLGLRRPTAGTLGWVDASGRPCAPRATATFQDYVRYEASLRDNVAFGDWPGHEPDDAAIGLALDRVELAGVRANLPDGLATLVGSRWDESRGLSGGQWQRVAIARCLYPSLSSSGNDGDAPQIRVLDEASSALDAQAEERLRALILGAALPGDGVTIYVTHRFPIIRAANLILVFQNGRLVEQGDHEHLLAAGGHYAELFNAQARGYADGRPKADTA
jgi:ATP-binding cassette subfamily B protein